MDDHKPFKLVLGNICPLAHLKNKGSIDW